MIIAVAETIGFAAIQTSSSKNYSYREGCCVCLEMARSFFSGSQVCEIVCGDGDEYMFSGSDDDLGMDDLLMTATWREIVR
jgi:hypothetical protein